MCLFAMHPGVARNLPPLQRPGTCCGAPCRLVLRYMRRMSPATASRCADCLRLRCDRSGTTALEGELCTLRRGQVFDLGVWDPVETPLSRSSRPRSSTEPGLRTQHGYRATDRSPRGGPGCGPAPACSSPRTAPADQGALG